MWGSQRGQVEYERGMGPPGRTLCRRPTEHPSGSELLRPGLPSRVTATRKPVRKRLRRRADGFPRQHPRRRHSCWQCKARRSPSTKRTFAVLGEGNEHELPYRPNPRGYLRAGQGCGSTPRASLPLMRLRVAPTIGVRGAVLNRSVRAPLKEFARADSVLEFLLPALTRRPSGACSPSCAAVGWR